METKRDYQTFTERMLAIKDWYLSEHAGSDTRSLEKLCSLGNGYFNTARKYPQDKVRTPVLEKVHRGLPEISGAWLAYGEGPMFTKDVPRLTESKNGKGSPYYDVDFLGGFDVITNDQTRNPDGFINMEPYNGRDFLWCNITGESMSPLIRSGSKICLKKLEGVDSIVYGEVYALVIGTEDIIRTVKWVTRADDDTMIRLVPENKDIKYGSYQDVKKSDVRFVFKVVFTGTVL